MNEKLLTAMIDMLIGSKLYNQIEETLVTYQKVVSESNILSSIYYLIPVYKSECDNQERTIFSKVKNVKELILRNTKLKFYLRRIEFDLLDNMDDFFTFLKEEDVSVSELMIVMKQTTVNFEKVMTGIRGYYESGKTDR